MSTEVQGAEVAEALEVYKKLQSAAKDVGGDTSISDVLSNLQIAMNMRKSQAQVEETGVLDYSALPPRVQSVLCAWDLDGSNKINCNDLASAAQAWKAMKKENTLVRKLLVAMAMLAALLLVGVFALSYLAVQAAKEMRPELDGKLVNTDGNPIRVASADFYIASDGTLRMREPAAFGGRRLQKSVRHEVVRVEAVAAALPSLYRPSGSGRRLSAELGLLERRASKAEAMRFASSARAGVTSYVRRDRGSITKVELFVFQEFNSSQSIDNEVPFGFELDRTVIHVPFLFECHAEDGDECVVVLPNDRASQNGTSTLQQVLGELGGSRRLGSSALSLVFGRFRAVLDIVDGLVMAENLGKTYKPRVDLHPEHDQPLSETTEDRTARLDEVARAKGATKSCYNSDGSPCHP